MKKRLFLLLTLMLIPTTVYASEGGFYLPFVVALGMEAFVSIHMSVFVLVPLSKIIFKENSRKAFWIMFIIRAVALIIIDTFYSNIALFDFIAVFVGAVIAVPVAELITKKKNAGAITETENIVETPSENTITTDSNPFIICPKCGKSVNKANKTCSCGETLTLSPNFCDNCGSALIGEKKFCSVCGKKVEIPIDSPKAKIIEVQIDPKYMISEKELLNVTIDEELKKIKATGKETLPELIKRKTTITIIFSVINFILLSLVFFHISIIIYLLIILNIIIYIIFMKKYNLKQLLIKQIVSRPDEKISYVISSTLANKISETDTKYKTRFIKVLAAIIISIGLPLYIFRTPHMFFENYEDGLYVRFYTTGLKNSSTIEVPEKHNGKEVMGIRGNVFKNIKSVKEIVLPDTIENIRGSAFENDTNLEIINMPKNLKRIGGSAFKNCKSLKSVEIPDTVVEMQGEIFSGCSSLENVKLSKNITEIRGNSFEYCKLLTDIVIPEGVTRIGGHAFYSCSSLRNVIIPRSVKEIGSSAFRLCPSLYNVTISFETDVNERAFKESPTSINYYDDYNDYNNYYDYYNSSSNYRVD